VYTTNFVAGTSGTDWGDAGTNMLVKIYTNGVATGMVMNFNTVANKFCIATNLTVDPFYIANGTGWSLYTAATAGTIISGTYFSFGIQYYPQ
jgi:hypothetical protein